MPPPSTIFGLTAAALGTWPARDAFRFAYRFTFTARGEDLEHQHVISASSGKLKGTQLPKSVEGSVQPTNRQFLFGARLTLYLDRSDWQGAFISPACCVTLGRSQDLATITDVRVVELEPASRAYCDRTLLPFSWRRRTPRGLTQLLPLWVGPPPQREAYFARYVMLEDRVYHDPLGVEDEGGCRLAILDDEPPEILIDPGSDEFRGMRRIVLFHDFATTER